MHVSKELNDWVVELRREFHMYPELSGQELRTTKRVMEALEGLGVKVYPLEGMTGAVGLVEGREEGPNMALRADMDALPINELNEVPYRSRQSGVMHACGHDAHTAILLGVARAVMSSPWRNQMKGSLVLLFQPSEERISGAREMITRGVLDNPKRVDILLACHVYPELPSGKVGLFKGVSHASADSFSLSVTGKGAHGGRPNEGVDPIVAGAYFVTSLQSIVSRNVNPMESAVVTVGKFCAGRAGNVIPETAELEGTLRALSDGVRKTLIERLHELKEGMEKSFRVSAQLQFLDSVPVCINDRGVTEFVEEVASRLLGPENVLYLEPSMGAEDFALFAQRRPSSIIRLGCARKDGPRAAYTPLHSPRFDIDETCLGVGVQLFAECARRYLT